MIETNNPEIDVEQLMSRIREEVAQCRPFVASAPASAGVAQGQGEMLAMLERAWAPLLEHPLQPGFTPNPERRYTLDDLLRFHDQDFVINAYLAVLRRLADSDGLQHYLNLLRQGESKVAILGRLRYSPEGRRQGVKIRGLAGRFLLDTLYRTPLLGWVLQTFAVLAHLPGLERNQRRFEAYAVQQWGLLNSRLSESSRVLQTALPPLRALLAELAKDKADMMADLQAALETLTEQVRELREDKADRAALETLAAQWREGDQQMRNDMTVQLRLLNEHKADAAQLTRLTNHFMEIVQAKADQTSIVGMVAEIREVQQRIQDHKRSLLDQQRRLGLLLEEARKRLPAPLDNAQLAIFASEADHLLDAMYVTFEDRFRGDRVKIKQQMAVYLPMIEAAQVGASDAPIVDIGCGRGEWLELLKERGLTARGVDLNRIMANECRERGFEVAEADALQYLRELPNNSLGAVTGMHIIEHLPLPALITLLDESLRVLRPGGLVIFETPNPENLVVGACNFYLDPSHRNPLPPLMMEYLVEARGFVRVEIQRWRQELRDPLEFLPDDQSAASVVNPLVRMAKDYYFATPDYAVIGYKA